jgi:hypothetical protein
MASRQPIQTSAPDSEPEKNPDSNATTLSFHLEDLKNEDFDSDDSNNTTDCNNLPPRELPKRAATNTVRAKTVTPAAPETREQHVIENAYDHTISALRATESFLFNFEIKTRRLKVPKIHEDAVALKELCHSHAKLYSRTGRNIAAAFDLGLFNPEQESRINNYVRHIQKQLNTLRLAWQCSCWSNKYTPSYHLVRGHLIWSTRWRKDAFDISSDEDTDKDSPFNRRSYPRPT